MDGGRGSSSGVPSAVKIELWHTDACGLTYIRNSSFEAVVHGQLHGIISMYKSTIFSGPEMTTDRIENIEYIPGKYAKYGIALITRSTGSVKKKKLGNYELPLKITGKETCACAESAGRQTSFQHAVL